MSLDVFDRLRDFGKWRVWLLENLSQASSMIVNTEKASLEALDYYNSLMNIQVSPVSKFSDTRWDFDDPRLRIARNIRGAKMAVDFTRYPHLSEFATLEFKVCLYIYVLAPAGVISGKKRPKSVKLQTVLDTFRTGLLFMDHMFLRARESFGDSYVESGKIGLTKFDYSFYKASAETYEFAFCNKLASFLSLVRSDIYVEYVFGDAPANIDVRKLPWNRVVEYGKKNSEASGIIPDLLLGQATENASFSIVHFLEAMKQPVADSATLKRKATRNFLTPVDAYLTPEYYDYYVIDRLSPKGYGDALILANLFNPTSFPAVPGEKYFKNYRAYKYKFPNNRVSDFMTVLGEVDAACVYIIAQYTAMRPSEIMELVTKGAIREEGSYHVLVSNVIKHEHELRRLFDDKWVAIPIVRDAVSAALLLQRYKQNPYLLSADATVAAGEKGQPMDSTGLKSRLYEHLSKFVATDELKRLAIVPYSTRHTLAHQLYRANVGLPFISHQLKHFANSVGNYARDTGFSKVTLEYGEIGDMLAKGIGRSEAVMRFDAQLESVRNNLDPDGTYFGGTAAEHRENLKSYFSGYLAAGYTKEEVFREMVRQNIPVMNVGQGLCYGNKNEEFDESLPCIGSLRCNPVRCRSAVITEAHKPRWREVYQHNKRIIDESPNGVVKEEAREAMQEAEMVLRHLGDIFE